MSSTQYTLPQTAPEPSSRGTPRLSYISRAQYSEEWNSNLHTHGCAELFFITDGHGRFRTQYEDFPVSIHDLIIVNANVPHTELSQMDSPLEYIVLGVEGLEAMAGTDGYSMLHLHSGWRELTACLELMLQEAQEKGKGHEEVCRHLLEVVLIRLERQEELSLSGESSDPRSSRECGLVRRYIDNHFKENLSLDQLAQLAHVNNITWPTPFAGSSAPPPSATSSPGGWRRAASFCGRPTTTCPSSPRCWASPPPATSPSASAGWKESAPWSTGGKAGGAEKGRPASGVSAFCLSHAAGRLLPHGRHDAADLRGEKRKGRNKMKVVIVGGVAGGAATTGSVSWGQAHPAQASGGGTGPGVYPADGGGHLPHQGAHPCAPPQIAGAQAVSLQFSIGCVHN